ncbi:hypothetical protein AYM17_05880 [Coxiella burnetii]|nr:hypothetical protein CbuG_1208 [Coxiella burnetii CbuG_Q212]ATN66920.1 hypothetical protein AYM17_05880 [Coxiella burnetii]OYK86242.1 hypothetical protein CbuQ229_06115 [Coxiella burnetii]
MSSRKSSYINTTSLPRRPRAGGDPAHTVRSALKARLNSLRGITKFKMEMAVTCEPKGFGTSLNSAYAIERALLEALQPLQLRTKKLNQVEKNTLQRLKDYPLFMDAAKADVGKLIVEKHYKEVDYNHLPTLTDADLKTQLSSILCAISNCGYSAYYSISTVLATNITCVKVLVPGLDKFHLVQLGKKIMPGKRCYDAIGFNESL